MTWKRMLSALLCVALVLTGMPLTAFAESTEDTQAAQTDPPDASQPLESVPEPVEETTAPTEATTAPTEATTVPTEATTVPTEATTVPTEATTVPTEETTAPTEETTVPTEETTVPTEETTAPVQEPAAPTQAQLVQAMIDALPDAGSITAENAQAVRQQLAAIDEAVALATEPLDGVDVTRYYLALDALSALESQTAGVAYIDEAGMTQTCVDAEPLTADMTALDWGWYVVSGSLTMEAQIEVTGEVGLILCDNSSLYVSSGIRVLAGGRLTVYSQSLGANMGILSAGQSSGPIVINGGFVAICAPEGEVTVHNGDVDVIPPVEEPTQPSGEATDPTEESTQPGGEATDPTEESTQPSEEATDPTEESTQPSGEATDPTEESTQPSEEATDPTEESTEPTEESTEPTEPVTAEQVQAMIDALPDAETITEENAEEVTARLAAIDQAAAELTEEEYASLDFTRYAEAVEALKALEAKKGLCPHHPTHTAECGYIAPNDGEPCQHEHTEACGEACPHTHDEECGYVEPNPGQPCGYDCKICQVQAMIDALPDPEDITADNAGEISAQLDAIDEAKAALADEEADELDFTRYQAVIAALMELEGMAGANEPDLLAEPWSGSGTAADPYLITSIADLQAFATNINGDNADPYKYSCFKLTQDITLNSSVLNTDGTLKNNGVGLQTWTPIGARIGDNDYSFDGLFDGDGHTISGLYNNTTNTSRVGLFGSIGGATIKNVSVTDSYFSGSSEIGGVCGFQYGGGIINCNFTGTVTGTSNVGGICGCNYGPITNCHNNGKIVADTGVGGISGTSGRYQISNCFNTGTVTGNTVVGGICGKNSASITNCYNNGTVTGSTVVGGICGQNPDSITNCYNNGTVTGSTDVGGVYGVNSGSYSPGRAQNCYNNSEKCSAAGGGTNLTAAQFATGEVTWALQNGQAKQAWGQSLSGTKDPFPVLTSNAAKRVYKVTFKTEANDNYKTYYVNSGATVALPSTPVAAEGWPFLKWATDKDAAAFTATTQITSDLTLNAYWNVVDVNYLDENGTSQSAKCVPVTTQTTLDSGWYVVNSNVTISDRINVSGDVHLILVDGTTLNSGGININSGNSLTIYAQSTGSSMGKLVATTHTDQEAGITCNGTLTINGGDITATGRQYGAGIGGRNAWQSNGRNPRGSCGTVIINGGFVKAIGTNNAAGIGGGQCGNGGTVIINGGTVEATAGPNGPHAIGAGGGDSGASNGSLKIGTPGSGKYWYVKGGADSSNQQNVSGSPFAAAQENIVTNVSGKKYVRIYQNVAPLPYIEADGTTGGCDEYTVLTNQTTLSSGWYVVNSNVTISDRITANGDVHLILCDGCTLNAQQGIAVNDGNSLTIYRQANHTGALTAGNPTEGGAAIGANRGTKAGTVIINGGIITASVTHNGGACIGQGGWNGGAGTVTINGGHLILSSSAGEEGAFGSSTTRTISGGIIEYTGSKDTISGATRNNCIVFNNSSTGTVYGDPTIDFNYTMGSGKTITVDSDQTLTITSGFTLTNNGTIHANGTLNYGEPTYGRIIGGGSIIGTFDFGDFKVTGDVSKVSYASNTLTIQNGADVTITMRNAGATTTSDRILVPSGAKANVTLAGVSIDMSDKNNTTAFMIEGGDANVALTLEAGTTNTLKSGKSCPGLGVKAGSIVTIKGDGALESTGGSEGAGIGGGHTFNAGTINIQSGTITATGGFDGAGIGGGHSNDSQGNQYGLFDNIHITGGVINAHSPGNAAAIGTGCWAKTCPGSITIENAQVTAKTDNPTSAAPNRCAAIGRALSKDSGNYDCAVTIKNSIVTAQNVANRGNTISGASGTPTIENSIVKVNAGSSHDSAYAVYGSHTLSASWTVPTGTTLFIDSGSSLTVGSGATLTNSGTIYVDGTLTGSVAGSVYYPLTVTGGEASPIVTQNSKTYAKAGDTITLTAEEKVGQSASWTATGVTVTGNTFTMPANAVTVTAQYENAPTYIVTIPASLTTEGTATIRASNVNVAQGNTLEVVLDTANVFTMTSGEGATLTYEVRMGGVDGVTLNRGDCVLQIPGGTANARGEVTLGFIRTPSEVERYSGTYRGSATFTVKVVTAP